MEPWERYRVGVGEPCTLTADDVPDHEYGFAHTDHWSDRKEERHVTDRVVDLLLTDPTEVRKTPEKDTYMLQRKINGEHWTLVFSDHVDPPPEWVLITIYSDRHGSHGTTMTYLERKGMV